MTPACEDAWAGFRLKGIIFDMDGTLTNSVDVYFETFRAAAVQVGLRVDRGQILGSMAVGAFDWERFVPGDIPDRAARLSAFRKMLPDCFAAAFPEVRPLPGVLRLLRDLAACGIRLGLVTTSQVSTLRTLEMYSALHFFHAVITRDDGFPVKPSPDGVVECLRRLQVAPQNGIMVGDTPLDIRAGKQVGLKTIGVLSGMATRALLEAEGPDAIIPDVTEIPRLLAIQDQRG